MAGGGKACLPSPVQWRQWPGATARGTPLLRFARFQWPRVISFCWLGWVVSGELSSQQASPSHEVNPTCDADLQGWRGDGVLLPWLGCLAVLWRCKCGSHRFFKPPEADPSRDTNPLLLSVWGCEGHRSSAVLCLYLGVTAPLGFGLQEQDVSWGLSPCHGEDSIIRCLSLCSMLFYCLSHDPFPRLTCTQWTSWSTRLSAWTLSVPAKSSGQGLFHYAAV